MEKCTKYHVGQRPKYTRTKAGAFAQREAHHVFSQGDQFLVPHWNRLGINVHDPRFMQWWPKPGHQQNDYAYRQMWKAFFRDNPKANINQVYAKGKEIMAHFGFTVLY